MNRLIIERKKEIYAIYGKASTRFIMMKFAKVITFLSSKSFVIILI